VTARRAAVSETEREVLKALWERPPSTVREIHDALKGQGRSWAYTTVQTLLHRLESKGYVGCDRAGSAHVFRAAVSREQFLQQRLTDLADQFCSGTASPLVLALVEGGRFTAEELSRFRELLDQLERESDPPSES
jgi:BlaI family transcriptional regulator, penicillinase repressor